MYKYQELFIYRYKSIMDIAVHAHKYMEIVYYEKGTGVTTIGGTQYVYEPNTFTVTPPNTPMSENHWTLTNPWCLYVAVKKEDFTLTSGLYRDSADRAVLEYLKRIKEEQATRRFHYLEALHGLVGLLAVEIARIQNIEQDHKKDFTTVIRYLEDHYDQEINIPELGGLMHYSYDRFRHLFKEAYGVSPKEYLVRCRIQRAKEYLHNGGYSAAYVSSLCGFSNPNHFNKMFKKYEGISPGEYRKGLKEKGI